MTDNTHPFSSNTWPLFSKWKKKRMKKERYRNICVALCVRTACSYTTHSHSFFGSISCWKMLCYCDRLLFWNALKVIIYNIHKQNEINELMRSKYDIRAAAAAEAPTTHWHHNWMIHHKERIGHQYRTRRTSEWTQRHQSLYEHQKKKSCTFYMCVRFDGHGQLKMLSWFHITFACYNGDTFNWIWINRLVTLNAYMRHSPSNEFEERKIKNNTRCTNKTRTTCCRMTNRNMYIAVSLFGPFNWRTLNSFALSWNICTRMKFDFDRVRDSSILKMCFLISPFYDSNRSGVSSAHFSLWVAFVVHAKMSDVIIKLSTFSSHSHRKFGWVFVVCSADVGCLTDRIGSTGLSAIIPFLRSSLLLFYI